jgi:hypothetical protein
MSPDALQTRPTSYFKARDLLDAARRSGELQLSLSQHAVFSYLLAHAVYQPKMNRDDYGRVVESALGNKLIAVSVGCSEKTVKRVLPVLEDLGLISRTNRPILTGGREAAVLRVTWLSRIPERDNLSPYERDTVAPSSSTREETNPESSRAGDDESHSSSTQTPNPARSRVAAAPAGYVSAVCQALSDELSDGSLHPTRKIQPGMNALARLWPAADDVPAQAIAVGFMTDSAWEARTPVGNDSAVLASCLEYATDDDVRLWAERGAERISTFDERLAAARAAGAVAEAAAEAEQERAQRRRQEILATMPIYQPPRVRPVARDELFGWMPGDTHWQPVWYHPGLGMAYAGGDDRQAGPEWQHNCVNRSAWRSLIKDRDVIELREADQASTSTLTVGAGTGGSL